jgi:hypothetical protein
LALEQGVCCAAGGVMSGTARHGFDGGLGGRDVPLLEEMVAASGVVSGQYFCRVSRQGFA